MVPSWKLRITPAVFRTAVDFLDASDFIAFDVR